MMRTETTTKTCCLIIVCVCNFWWICRKVFTQIVAKTQKRQLGYIAIGSTLRPGCDHPNIIHQITVGLGSKASSASRFRGQLVPEVQMAFDGVWWWLYPPWTYTLPLKIDGQGRRSGYYFPFLGPRPIFRGELFFRGCIFATGFKPPSFR